MHFAASSGQRAESVGHSEHVPVNSANWLSVLLVPSTSFLRVSGHALVEVLARESGQFVRNGVASPVVLEMLPLSSSCSVWCPGIHFT